MMKKFSRGLASSFILHGKIQTTLAKAKVARPVIEKIISLAKKNSLSSHRRVQSFLQNPSLVNKLVKKVKDSTRASGFTRLIHTSTRRGDNAPLARLEWTDPLASSKPSGEGGPLPSHPTHKTHKSHKTHSKS